MIYAKFSLMLITAACLLGQARHTGPGDKPVSEGPQKLWVTPMALADTSLLGLLKASDLVVRGTVENSLPSRMASADNMETDSRIAVAKVLKGNPSIHEIMVSQMGGQRGATQVIPQQYDLMKPGEQYILFLKRDLRPSTPVVSVAPAYNILSSWVGSFPIFGGRVSPSTRAPRNLHDLYDQMDVGVFEQQIVRLAEAQAAR